MTRTDTDRGEYDALRRPTMICTEHKTVRYSSEMFRLSNTWYHRYVLVRTLRSSVQTFSGYELRERLSACRRSAVDGDVKIKNETDSNRFSTNMPPNILNSPYSTAAAASKHSSSRSKLKLSRQSRSRIRMLSQSSMKASILALLVVLPCDTHAFVPQMPTATAQTMRGLSTRASMHADSNNNSRGTARSRIEHAVAVAVASSVVIFGAASGPALAEELPPGESLRGHRSPR